MNFFDFTVLDNKGVETPLANYKGKVLLVVNTATGCGLTPQYDALQKLYDDFGAQGFEILDFPCNQFLEQAKGSDDEINQLLIFFYTTSTISTIDGFKFSGVRFPFRVHGIRRVCRR